MDIVGHKIHTFKLSGDATTYSVDLTTLPKGIYVMSVHTGETVQTRKIVLE